MYSDEILNLECGKTRKKKTLYAQREKRQLFHKWNGKKGYFMMLLFIVFLHKRHQILGSFASLQQLKPIF